MPTPDGGWDRRVLRNEYIIFYDSGLNLALMCDPKKCVHTFVYKLQVLGNRAPDKTSKLFTSSEHYRKFVKTDLNVGNTVLIASLAL